MSEKVTKEMTVGEILEKDPEAAYSLMEMGLGCAGCPMSQFETLEQGAMVHGMDADRIVENLNKGKKEPTPETRMSEEANMSEEEAEEDAEDKELEEE